MPLGSTFANDLAKLVLQALAIANIADNAAASPLTNLYISLHTADPGAAGNQQTNECAYTSYARVSKARSGAGFTVTGNVVNPASNIAFPTATGGSETATHVMIGTAASGAGKQLIRGTISPAIVISNGVAPTLTTATAINFLTT